MLTLKGGVDGSDDCLRDHLTLTTSAAIRHQVLTADDLCFFASDSFVILPFFLSLAFRVSLFTVFVGRAYSHLSTSMLTAGRWGFRQEDLDRLVLDR